MNDTIWTILLRFAPAIGVAILSAVLILVTIEYAP